MRAASGDALSGEHKFQLVRATHRVLLSRQLREDGTSVLRSPGGSQFHEQDADIILVDGGKTGFP